MAGEKNPIVGRTLRAWSKPGDALPAPEIGENAHDEVIVREYNEDPDTGILNATIRDATEEEERDYLQRTYG